MSQRYALLVGITDYPNCRPEDQLRGCVNDALAWQTLLTSRFGFPPEHVRMLHNPGRQAILEAFESHLIARAGPGDLIVFAFSGHGSYTWDLEGDEPDGFDETLVPSDAYRDPTREPRHITDDEIFELNARLKQKISGVGFVVFIVDACHSGSITRGVGRARFLDPELPPTPKAGLPAKPMLSPALRQLGGTGYQTWLPDLSSYVLLAACRDDERAYETEDRDRNPHGAFSLFLTQALQRASRPMTYLDLLERAAPRVRGCNPNQNPQLEGDGKRAVFGFERVEHEPYLPIRAIDDDGVTLGGGSAHLVTRGSRFAIYPPGTRSPREAQAAGAAPLAHTTVTRVQAVSARAVYEPTTPHDSVNDQCRAFEVQHNYDSMQLPVAVVGAPPEAAAAHQTLNGSPLLRLVGLDESPRLVVWAVRPGVAHQIEHDLTIPRGLEDGPSFVITDNGGEVLMQPAPAGTAVHLAVLRENVERIARHLNLLALENENPGAILRGKVELTLKRLERRDGLYGPVPPEFDREPIFTEGDLIMLEIANRHDAPIYFSVFDLGLSWRVSLLYPPGLESERLASGQTFVVGLRPPGIPTVQGAAIPSVFPAGRAFGRETFKVLATTRPADFNWLVQPGVEVPVERADDPLRDLLSLVRSGRTPAGLTFRGDDFAAPGSQEWITAQVTFVLKRRGDST